MQILLFSYADITFTSSPAVILYHSVGRPYLAELILITDPVNTVVLSVYAEGVINTNLSVDKFWDKFYN